ncbi:MAG: DHH family phosphoesterase [Acidimicrobiia bacterium]
MTEAIQRAAEMLRTAGTVAVACHVGPDGDALGSALGLALSARRAGKQAVASFGSPFGVSDNYRFLPLEVLVPPSQFPAEPEVLVAFDVAAPERLGELAKAAKAAGCLIIIDHHISNKGFGDIDVIDPEAAASAQLAYYLIRTLDWPLDAEVATCLLTGLVTDTGRFQYSNATPEALRVAAALVEAGARPEVIGQSVYERVPFGFLHVEAAVLERSVLEPELAFVWSVLRIADLERAGIGLEETESLIDALRVAREAQVAGLVKELSGGEVKVSLRSRGAVDVEAIASSLGGGGHHNASGFTYRGSADEAIAEVRVRLASRAASHDG